MKHLLFILTALVLAGSAQAADVGVSVTVGQPGFYGQIDIGNLPKPQVIFPKPVVIAPMPVQAAPPPPVYIHVPPGHEKNWGKHCRKYNACDRPVYFVRDQWYNEVYVPEYRARRGPKDGKYRDDRDDRRGDRDDRGGKGKGHAKGHGKSDR
jgi:hypothetical protein